MACCCECEVQGFTRDILDEWSGQPTEAGGNVAGQGNGVALDVHAAIGLIKAPVRIQAPQKAVIIFRRGRTLLRGASAFNFGDASAVRNGCRVGAVHDEILDFVFGIQDNGEDVRFFQSQKTRNEFPVRDRSLARRIVGR